MKGTWVLAALACATMGLGASSLSRAEEKGNQKKFEQWTKTLADLEKMDTAKIVTQDIEMLRTWISQGQALAASDKGDEVAPIEKKVEAHAEYAKAKIERDAMEKKATEAEASAKLEEEKAKQITDTANSMEKRMQELEAKGL